MLNGPPGLVKGSSWSISVSSFELPDWSSPYGAGGKGYGLRVIGKTLRRIGLASWVEVELE